MASLQDYIKREYAKGNQTQNMFDGDVPRISTNFEVGDIFTLPTKYLVFIERIERAVNQFIFVETKSGEVRKLYPLQLSRKVRIYNTDGSYSGIAQANGTASQLYMSHLTVQEGMEALSGKTIRVSKITSVQTMQFDNLHYRTVYTFDLV